MIDNGLLQFSFENGLPDVETPSATPDPAQQALQETLTSTQAECTKLAEKVAKTQRDLEAAQAELSISQNQLESCRKTQEAATVDHRVALEAAKRETEAARTDTQRLKSAVDRLEGYIGSPSGGLVQVISVNWGGTFYDHIQSVRDRLNSLIVRNEEFKVANSVCENDPIYGLKKWLVVVYRFLGPEQNGRIRTFVGYEDNMAKFDALGSP